MPAGETTMPTPNGIRVAGRNLKDIMADLNKILLEHGIDDQLGVPWDVDPVWPVNGPFWVACFPVNGRSEAFWVHIEFIYPHPRPKHEIPPKPERQLIALVKTWNWEHAKTIAGVAADAFEGPRNCRDD